jgi:large subunit ribosomal protein L4
VFGPQPRDYGFKLNKKVKDLARNSALAYKAKQNGIMVLEDVKMEKPKTKLYAEMLKNVGVAGKRVLMVYTEADNNTILSGRNIPKTEMLPAANLNTYAIVKANCIILSESTVNFINQSFTNN